MGEDQVGGCSFLVARETGLHEGRGRGFAVLKVTESPAAGCGVFCRVLDHELNVGGSAGNERLDLAEDFVVLVLWNVLVMKSDEDRAVGERIFAVAEGVVRYIVGQESA